MLKQRLTLNQGPTKSGRTRDQNRDVVMGASDDRLDVRSCGAPYSLPSLLKDDALARSWCYHCRDASDPWVLVLSSDAFLLMAVLQVFANFLHLKIFTLVSDEVM